MVHRFMLAAIAAFMLILLIVVICLGAVRYKNSERGQSNKVNVPESAPKLQEVSRKEPQDQEIQDIVDDGNPSWNGPTVRGSRMGRLERKLDVMSADVDHLVETISSGLL